jgi:hypothetical protein
LTTELKYICGAQVVALVLVELLAGLVDTLAPLYIFQQDQLLILALAE